MNERIEKLAEDCFEYFEPNCLGETMEFNYKKFAELIVRECAELMEQQHTWISNVAASNVIRKHFGVE